MAGELPLASLLRFWVFCIAYSFQDWVYGSQEIFHVPEDSVVTELHVCVELVIDVDEGFREHANAAVFIPWVECCFNSLLEGFYGCAVEHIGFGFPEDAGSLVDCELQFQWILLLVCALLFQCFTKKRYRKEGNAYCLVGLF